MPRRRPGNLLQRHRMRRRSSYPRPRAAPLARRPHPLSRRLVRSPSPRPLCVKSRPLLSPRSRLPQAGRNPQTDITARAARRAPGKALARILHQPISKAIARGPSGRWRDYHERLFP
jgi:hypothetical protein